MCNNCHKCCNCQGTRDVKIADNIIKAIDCKAYPSRLFSEAKDCPNFNKDLSEAKICGNCEYFLGGGDWGLSCSKHYYSLPEYTSKACKDMSWKKMRT